MIERAEVYLEAAHSVVDLLADPAIRRGGRSRRRAGVVHSDDLAVSAGIETPPFPLRIFELVLDLLSRLAVTRHGQSAVLRALTRAERAPEAIAAL